MPSAVDDPHAAAGDLGEDFIFAETLTDSDDELLPAPRIGHGPLGGRLARVRQCRAGRRVFCRLMDGHGVGHWLPMYPVKTRNAIMDLTII